MSRPAEGRLDDITVLIPRSPQRAAGLARRLEELGARTLISAVISRAAIEDTALIDDAVAHVVDGEFTWVAVTSVNAIDELTASAARHETTLADLPVRWAAVGRATATALEAAGVTVEFRPTEASGAALAAELPLDHDPDHPSPSVLLPLGDLASPTAAAGLRDRGFKPHVVTAYRTVAHPVSSHVSEEWRAGTIDVVVLTSGSVTREVASQLGPHACVAGVTIGEPTARAALDVHVRVDVVAKSADDEGLEAAVLEAIALRVTPDAENPTAVHNLDAALDALPLRTPHLDIPEPLTTPEEAP